MEDYQDEIIKEANEQAKKDSEILERIHILSTKEFYKDFLRWISDEENGIIGYYNIVEKPKGKYQTENDFGLIKGMWVDQYTTPTVGDDYHGYLTIELENGEYFECSFNLG